jgi:hypothetical protein
MLVTEEQAREKWCPFVRFDNEGCNRHHVQAHRMLETGEQVARYSNDNPVYARCVASECMAWTWKSELDKSVPLRTGYCGLAGKSYP